MKSVKQIRKAYLNRYEGLIRVIKHTFVAPVIQSKLATYQSGSPDGEDLLFVSGFAKSGTTWITDLLDNHPDIVCRTEGFFFNLYNPDIPYLHRQGGYKAMIEAIQGSEWWKDFGYIWLKEQGIEASVKRMILDSMRSFREGNEKLIGVKSTVQDLVMTRTVFPKAKLVGIIRDGRDVAVSRSFHWQRVGKRGRFEENGQLEVDYLRDFARGWSTYAQHMYDEQKNTNTHIIRYEDLLREPVKMLTGILEHIGVNAEPQLVERISAGNSFEKQSGGRKPGEEDKTSHRRKGISGDWKNHFSDEGLKAFMEVASKSMAAWGYSD